MSIFNQFTHNVILNFKCTHYHNADWQGDNPSYFYLDSLYFSRDLEFYQSVHEDQYRFFE